MHHLTAVPIVAVKDTRDIDVHYVALLQGTAVRDSVADDLVDGGANAFGKRGVPIIQWSRSGSGFYVQLVGIAVKFISRHPSLCARTGLF
jgi:hypothetical protein